MATLVGDTPGSLVNNQRGDDQTLSGSDDENNEGFGDAAGSIRDDARGGDDVLVGGTIHFGGSFRNVFFGDSEILSGSARGGNDSLTGGDLDQNANADLTNILYGDAFIMAGSARGGDDSVTGGNNNSNVFSVVVNVLYGDGNSLSGNARGGDDTLTGGSSSGNRRVDNYFHGDALSMSDTAKGGNDVLIAGTGNFTLNPDAVSNTMWGDAPLPQMLGLAEGGADTFVFRDQGSMTVGTDNIIYDFSQSQHDKIMFIGVAGVTTFDDLTFDTATLPGSTIIHAGADAVTLASFNDTLTAQDFLVGSDISDLTVAKNSGRR
jgi:hypothetical protein